MLIICRIIELVNEENLVATLLFIDFSKFYDSIHRGRMEQIQIAYGHPIETVVAIMIFHKIRMQ